MGGQVSAWPLLALVSPHSTVLKSTFPFKKEEKIQELMEAGGWHPSSSNADLLNYHSLFAEVCQGSRNFPSPALASSDPSPCALTLSYGLSQDEEGQSRPFVQQLWEQYLDEKDDYLQELKQELGLEL